jgi:hypothetical protein
MRDNQEKLIHKIKQLGRFLTDDEIMEFYLDNVQRKTCRIGIFQTKGEEYKYYDLKNMATSFYVRAIGRACISGKLRIMKDTP